MSRFSQRSVEGEVVIDHRASPGTIAVPEGQVLELPTVTCSHCQRTWIRNDLRTRPRHWCLKCDHYVCDEPGCVAMMSGPETCRLSDRLEILRNDLERGALVIAP